MAVQHLYNNSPHRSAAQLGFIEFCIEFYHTACITFLYCSFKQKQ